MMRRQVWRAFVLSAITLSATVVPFSLSGALKYTSANENAHTIVLSLPGPFNGCTILDAGATASSDSILDLIRPSAFLTLPNGSLTGEGGAIASAELTSLQPETVRYTIAPKETWSDGSPFNGSSLVAWWQKAKSLASVQSDGYRDIQSLTVSHAGLTVTAVFATPYADWNTLFRDVEAAGAPSGCAISNLVKRPSLGAYTVTSASANQIVLSMNPTWPVDANRYGHVIITDSTALPTSTKDAYASYGVNFTSAQIEELSSHSNLLSHIGSSSVIEELTFAPIRAQTTSRVVREALSWSIPRQNLIDVLYGAVTYEPSVAASAIYSQGQNQYPGSSGTNPVGQATTTTVAGTPSNGLADCVTCALAVLKLAGYATHGTELIGTNGVELRIRLAVGPSALDRRAAKLIVNDWAAIGIATSVVKESSEIAASHAASNGSVAVALFARPTTTTPAYTARSWSGLPYPDAFPSGDYSAQVNTLFTQASAIFNPVTASSTWLQLDQYIMSHYWVRPLFTEPMLMTWTSTLVTVGVSFTVQGFVDAMPTWSISTTTTPS
jgi:ABC-type transport system substrate-binding protein